MLKQRVRRAFNRAAETYDAAAAIQQQVAQRLRERLPDGISPDRLVDVGCGTGYALPILHARYPQAQVTALDLAERMLGKLPAAYSRICADAEHLPIAGASVDLYWSSLAVQWCHLPAILREARRVLRPDGHLAIATLATRTFHELRTAFSGLDAHPHTHSFLAAHDIAAAARAAGLADVQIGQEALHAGYPDLATLLRAVKAVGASEVGGERRRGMLGRTAWAIAQARYEAFRVDGLVQATYDIVYLTARSPN